MFVCVCVCVCVYVCVKFGSACFYPETLLLCVSFSVCVCVIVCVCVCVCVRAQITYYSLLLGGFSLVLKPNVSIRYHLVKHNRWQQPRSGSLFKVLLFYTTLFAFPPFYETLLLKWIVSAAAARCCVERERERAPFKTGHLGLLGKSWFQNKRGKPQSIVLPRSVLKTRDRLA